MALQRNYPLNLSHLKKSTLIINRLYTLFHSIAIILLICYRVSSTLSLIHTKTQPFIPHLLIFVSELTLSFLWLLSQSFLWRPVTRTVFPERLPEDEQLPPIDVFICTADPQKEPLLGVMNTVVSAMALNYPPEKLSVYLSDDGGCPVTLQAMREAFKFAKKWVPFCNKYGVKTICPGAYFSGPHEGDDTVMEMVDSNEFGAEKDRLKVSLHVNVDPEELGKKARMEVVLTLSLTYHIGLVILCLGLSDHGIRKHSLGYSDEELNQ